MKIVFEDPESIVEFNLLTAALRQIGGFTGKNIAAGTVSAVPAAMVWDETTRQYRRVREGEKPKKRKKKQQFESFDEVAEFAFALSCSTV